VTPPYVGGGFVGGTVKSELPTMSSNGEHLLGLVFAGFAGTENLEQDRFEYGAVYEFSRTASGWSTEPWDPSAAVYPRREYLMASADLSKSLWYVQKPLEPGHELPIVPPTGLAIQNNDTLVVREAAGGGKGRFEVVGPVVAPGHEPSTVIENFQVRDASADLSHILLDVVSTDKQLWPGDQTLEGGPSLYEYAGTDETEPELVGVENESSLPEEAAREGKAHVNEAAELISRCGTVAGANEAGGSLNNAISANGGTVFFTALACAGGPQVNELYARVDGKHTVKISEPTTGPSGDCEACQERELQPAIFAGASEDGSKVFFYSEQELLPEARGMNLYEYDFDAPHPHERLTLVAAEVAQADAIAGEGAYVYLESPGLLTAAANGNGETARLNGQNVYAYNTATGALSFVGDEAFGVRTTRTGHYMVFESDRHFAGTEDAAAVAQLFEYDAQTGVISRVSVGQATPGECEETKRIESRYGCDGSTSNGEYTPVLPKELSEQLSILYSPADAASSLAVAENGEVVFQSRDALAPGATPGGRNIYEYRGGEVFLISPGSEPIQFEREGGETRMLGISETGNNVFFSSPEQLVPQDTGTQEAWYDAREGGGFPGPVSPPTCAGEACRGATSAPPTLLSAPRSIVTPGGGNLAAPAPVSKPKATPTKKCKKGYVKKKSKCVKQAKAKKANRAKGSS
jgi:hypothetical protein